MPKIRAWLDKNLVEAGLGIRCACVPDTSPLGYGHDLTNDSSFFHLPLGQGRALSFASLLFLISLVSLFALQARQWLQNQYSSSTEESAITWGDILNILKVTSEHSRVSPANHTFPNINFGKLKTFIKEKAKVIGATMAGLVTPRNSFD